MNKLQAIEIDDGTVIYIEAVDAIDAPLVVAEAEEMGRVQKGIVDSSTAQLTKSFKVIEDTIKVYTRYTLNAFRDSGLAEVKKVTLEFGVNVSGIGGIPYIAAGTAGCNLKITVECAFPDRQLQPQ